MKTRFFIGLTIGALIGISPLLFWCIGAPGRLMEIVTLTVGLPGLVSGAIISGNPHGGGGKVLSMALNVTFWALIGALSGYWWARRAKRR